jgi:hypothetical protein
MEQHSRIIRARRVVEAVLAAAHAASAIKPVKPAMPKTVANITDPQSRLMPTRKGFCRAITRSLSDGDHFIVATHLGQNTNDRSSFLPKMHAAERAYRMLHAENGRPSDVLGVVLADACYCSDRNLAAPGPARLIALTETP